MKTRLRNYALWVSVAALIPLVAQAFGWQMPGNYDQIVNVILSILVTAGVLNNPTTINTGYKDDVTTEQGKKISHIGTKNLF
jgi:uncharacterized membrane protein